MYIGDWLARREQLTPHKIALIDAMHGGRPITYRDWNRAANRTARLLREGFGVRKGDRMAVLAMNRVEYLDIWFACGKLGAILQNLNWRLTPYELGALIDDAAPVVLVYDATFADQVVALRQHSSPIEHYVAFDAAARAHPDDELFAERDDLPDTVLPPAELTWDDPWIICYTGGTTGLPKGALLTHRWITWNAINTNASWGLTEAGPNTFWLPPEDVRRKPGAVGLPLMHIDVKLVTHDGRECGPDEPGELLIRGPHVCAGYWNRPEETARLIVDGWLHMRMLFKPSAERYFII